MLSTWNIIAVLSICIFHGSQGSLSHGMDTVEYKIFTLINSHRQQHGLPSLQASVNLAYVAHTHAVDVIENNPDVNGGNMHSWSNKGKWKPVTYTSDHRYAQLMWSKPSEISNYKFNGYEISFGYGKDVRKTRTMDPDEAVRSWKSSPGHNSVMIQQGAFSNMPMKAMGVGVYKGYACVWFGQQLDTYPAPDGTPGEASEEASEETITSAEDALAKYKKVYPDDSIVVYKFKSGGASSYIGQKLLDVDVGDGYTLRVYKFAKSSGSYMSSDDIKVKAFPFVYETKDVTSGEERRDILQEKLTNMFPNHNVNVLIFNDSSWSRQSSNTKGTTYFEKSYGSEVDIVLS